MSTASGSDETVDEPDEDRPRIKGGHLLPNLVTLLNALAGVMAIAQLFKAMQYGEPRHLEYAAWLILLGMLFDGLDGKLARMMNSTSFFGIELDSLCDAITFGVAPALLMYIAVYQLRTHGGGHPVLETLSFPVAALYLFCVLVRLARFNVEKDIEAAEHGDFAGLPSPAAAGVISSGILFMLILGERLYGEVSLPEIVGYGFVQLMLQAAPWLVFMLALSMVSRIRYPHLLDRIEMGDYTYLQAVVSAVIALGIVVLMLFDPVLTPVTTLFGVFFLYALSGPLEWAGYALLNGHDR
jgi:CDP-diacylglycerol--serine O-phosphatidyltransferase